MPREMRSCLIPRAICFNNSLSVICAVPLSITAQNDNFKRNFLMTYLSFWQKGFMFVENIHFYECFEFLIFQKKEYAENPSKSRFIYNLIVK